MSKKIGFLFLALLLCRPEALAAGPLFSDVPTDSWYAPYVEQLVLEGIVDTGIDFRPADSLNRAELVKMVITVIDGLKDYSEPPTATFDDVPKGAWFYDHVEQAATLGIVMGYSDAEGSLTGFFGPADTVTRAAAVKILVEAFDLEPDTSVPTPYKDVHTGDWFSKYVATASQYGVVQGYSNGNFGPADPVTRAQMAKMIALSAEASGLWEHLVIEEEEEPIAEEEPITEEEPEPLPAGEAASANTAYIEATNVSAGNKEVFVAKYVFKALREGFHVETVTIVNDITGSKLGDEPEGTAAIKNIILKFPDKDGHLVTESGVLGSDGKARFANLEFFAKRDSDSFFEVYVDLNSFSEVGQDLSGEVFRLGIQDIGNTSGSFRAVGDITDTVITGTGNSGNLSMSGSQVHPFTVRKSVPLFSLNGGSGILTSGDNILISYDVAADPAGSIGLARLVFDVYVSDSSGAGLSLSDFRLFRGSNLMESVGIYDSTGLQDLTPAGGGSLTHGSSFVIVTFEQEETISKGDSQTYSLRASVSGPKDNDSISTRFAQGDEISPLTGLTGKGQSNTGKIYVNGDPTTGIFTGASDFFQSLMASRNILWSDQSADFHLYPTVSGGVITSDTGSSDWTNGYLLDLSGLYDHTLSN